MVLTSVLMVANWWPCSASSSLDDRLGPLDLGGVVLAFDRKPDLFLLEAVEDVGNGNRVQALVVDLADGGLLADKDVEDDALFRVLALDAQVLEVAGVPERVEIALDGDRIVGIAGVGEHPGQDGFLGDAPVADDANLVDGVGRLGQGCQAHLKPAPGAARCAPAASTIHMRGRWKCA